MHYGSCATHDLSPRNSSGSPQLVQPTDPLTDRIQKALSEISSIICGAEADLSMVSSRLFGERLTDGSEGPVPTPNGAEEAIMQSLRWVTSEAVRVRALAAELNGRI